MLPLLLTVVAAAGEPTLEAANLLRVYDLRPALAEVDSEWDAVVLSPVLQHSTGGQISSDTISADLVVELVRSVCGEELDYEGRTIEHHGEGALRIGAPAALHARAEKAIGFLARALSAETVLAIDVLSVSGPAEKEVPVLLSEEEATKLIAGAGGRRSSWRVRAQPGRTTRLDLTRPTALVGDFDVEIAQASAIHDPVIDRFLLGSLLHVRAAPAPGGTWLALSLRQVDPIGEVQDHPLEFWATITLLADDSAWSRSQNQSQPQWWTAGTRPDLRPGLLQGPRRWQSLAVQNRSLALTTFLPEGKALCLQTTLALQGVRETRLVVVRRAGPPLAIQQRLALEGGAQGAGSLTVVDVDAYAPPRCVVEGTPAAAGLVFESRNQGPDEGPLSVRIERRELDGVEDLVYDDRVSTYTDGPWLFVTSAGEAPMPAAEIDERLVHVARCAPVARLYRVGLLLRRGSTILARCAVPVREGERSAVALGVEDSELVDFDVEVAQGAAVADPVIGRSFAGLCVALRPLAGFEGGLLLEVDAFGQVRRGEPRAFVPDVPTLGAIQGGAYDRIEMRERVEVPSGGARPFVLGDLGTGGESLTLEIEAAEVR